MDVDKYFYIAKCVLGFTTREAWRLTIRQIHAMMVQHNRYHGAPEPVDDDETD